MMVRGNHPQMAELFRLVNYSHLPRTIVTSGLMLLIPLESLGIYPIYDSWDDPQSRWVIFSPGHLSHSITGGDWNMTG